jgi:hypothetical protein
VEVPRHTNGHNSNKKDYKNVKLQQNLNISNENNIAGAPRMKGNIGPSKKNTYIDPDEVDIIQKRIWRKLAEEFDIDNVIPVAQQRV